jgi:peptide deformylase
LIRDIVKVGRAELRAENAPVAEFDASLAELVRDLVETCHAAPGLGLAAPQIGVNRRVAVVDLSIGKDPGSVVVLVNPRILSEEGRQRGDEGCLSIPGLSEVVERPSRVVVEARNASGEPARIEGDGLLARALCHEIDHLDSRLFIDNLKGLKKEMIERRLRRRWGGT